MTAADRLEEVAAALQRNCHIGRLSAVTDPQLRELIDLQFRLACIVDMIRCETAAARRPTARERPRPRWWRMWRATWRRGYPLVGVR